MKSDGIGVGDEGGTLEEARCCAKMGISTGHVKVFHPFPTATHPHLINIEPISTRNASAVFPIYSLTAGFGLSIGSMGSCQATLRHVKRACPSAEFHRVGMASERRKIALRQIHTTVVLHALKPRVRQNESRSLESSGYLMIYLPCTSFTNRNL